MRNFWAEFIGTAMLLIGVVGSGIMGETLSGGNTALALLANALATGAMLFVIIATIGPISGAHFNPIVTLFFLFRGEVTRRDALTYIAAQITGGPIGVALTHLMFDLAIIQTSTTLHRTGPAQWSSEALASFGLLFVIYSGLRARADQVPMLVAIYITGAYWFTASTSFANPVVTIARAFTDTFAGIYPGHAPMFIVMQGIGMLAALAILPRLFGSNDP